MSLHRLEITNLLAFKKLDVEFSPGITVLIGKNSTGKTHILKLAYAMLRAGAERELQRETNSEVVGSHLRTRLLDTFRPDTREIGRLVHRGPGRASGKAKLAYNGGIISMTVTSPGRLSTFMGPKPPSSVYLPPRDVLGVYVGFAAAMKGRELMFDATYLDLCEALARTALRGPRAETAKKLIQPLLDVLGGRIVLDSTGFYLKSAQGNLEAPLLSEGMRKIGMLVHLIANGSLGKNSVLFWDEPESSLNPALVRTVVVMLQELVKNGVQVVLATHDFLLSQELSLEAEYAKDKAVPTKFIALSRGTVTGEISAQSGAVLSDLSDNPILAEFAAHYDREQAMFAGVAGRRKGGE